MRASVLLFLPVLLAGAAGSAAERTAPAATGRTLEQLTAAEREAYVRRAQVWQKTDVPSMDVRMGPAIKGALPGTPDLTCTFKTAKLSGHSPKFQCELPGGDLVKVKYGTANGEVFAEVAGTRLFWALGFYADAEYPVRVTCLGCPSDPWKSDKDRQQRVVFERAIIERSPFADIAEAGHESEWSFGDLYKVDESQGGAPAPQRDALRLLAAFVQHGDNKSINQRVVCLHGAVKKDAAGNETCAAPIMMIHDLGNTFGRGNLFRSTTTGSANYKEWSAVPMWDPDSPEICEADLGGAVDHHTLKDPEISEAGRKFLADLLVQLTDDQIRGLFEVSSLADRAWHHPEHDDRNGTIDQWVQAFKAKRDQLVSRKCPR
jgi:hypothetical protein